MNYETRQVLREWDNEVETEMRRLIERGTPPYEAIDKARDIVSRRRSEQIGELWK